MLGNEGETMTRVDALQGLPQYYIDIAKLAAQGKEDHEISRNLGIGLDAIRQCWSNLAERLNVSNRVSLAAQALEVYYARQLTILASESQHLLSQLEEEIASEEQRRGRIL
jgi:DNA-binding NarL/FixJ family response regulator